MAHARVWLEWLGPERTLVTEELPEDGKMITLGRSNDVSVVIRGDQTASRVHAGVTYTAGAWLIEDLNSTLGTFLIRGGCRERVRGRAALRDGDRIGIGRTILKFVNQSAPDGERGEYFERSVTLSARQREFLRALCRNRLEGNGGPPSNSELALELHLTVDGVRAHLRTLYDMFGLGSVPEKQKKGALIEIAVDEGWVLADDEA